MMVAATTDSQMIKIIIQITEVISDLFTSIWLTL